MKPKYTFLLLPDIKTTTKINHLRKKAGSPLLVDSFPPHLTIKRGFTLKKEEYFQVLLDITHKSPRHKFALKVISKKIFKEALTLEIEKSNSLDELHQYFLLSLAKIAVSKNLKLEGKNFIPHLTLIRKKGELEKVSLPTLKEITFTKLCLYKADPTKKRAWSELVCEVKLT